VSISVTRSLRSMQLVLLLVVLLAVAWLIRPHADLATAGYLLVPLAAAGVATVRPVSVSPAGRGPGSWLAVLGLLGLGGCLITLPWLAALFAALDGRADLLKGFVGAVNQDILWRPLQGPSGAAWASVLGIAIAAATAVRLRHHGLLLCAAMCALLLFAASGILLTAEPGETVPLAALRAPGRAATGLALLLPVGCVVAGAWLSFFSPPTLATWRLRWLTVASALTFLTEYPRVDDMHLAWSAGLPLATGAVVLGRTSASLAARWNVGRIARGALGAALLTVPIASVIPNLAERSQGYVQVSEAGLHLAPEGPASHLSGLAGLIVTDEQAATLLAAARYVEDNTAPGEPIFVYPSSPLVYVISNRPNPTRFAHLYPGAASPDELNHVIAILADSPVRVVVVSDAALSFWGPPAANAPLETYLGQMYRDVARFGEYRVLTRVSGVSG
jgi:hypothetical protein